MATITAKPAQAKNAVPAPSGTVAMPVSTPGYVNGTPEWIKPIIDNASKKFNIPPMLLSALIKQESGFNPKAKSPAGAIGIAQFMPGTAQGMGIDPWNPDSAVNGAAQYLRNAWDHFGKPELALAAYNAGGGAVSQYGGIPPYKETQNYVKNIMSMAGEPHESANGPLLQTLSDMRDQVPKALMPQSNSQSLPPMPMPQPTPSEQPSAPVPAYQPRAQAPTHMGGVAPVATNDYLKGLYNSNGGDLLNGLS